MADHSREFDNESVAVCYSSLGTRGTNHDGTVRVHCFQCRRYIASTNYVAGFRGSLCINCQRENEGLAPLPEEMRTIYMPGMGDVLESTVFQKTPQQDPMIGDTSVAPTSTLKYIRQVISNLNKTITGKKILPKEPESRKIAREKKQKRVFADGITLNDKTKE